MLETLFQGYESHGPPTAYIFMGSFCSRSFVPTGQGVRAYREGFERLKFMMRNLEAHVMHGTRFVFIPGPRDPGPQTLPKAPLPDYLTANLAVDIPGAVGKPKRPCFDVFFVLFCLARLRQAKAKKERSSVGSLRELQLSQKETELASREAGSPMDCLFQTHSKHLRLVNALDRQRIAEVMATNPCHIRHLSREMVFFRHDVLRLLKRHEAVPLARESGFDEPSWSSECARFILDQAHLLPLPLEESNILWEHDHALRLYPLPHAVFIGGVTPRFETNYQECTFGSVGPFG
eukprot:g11204.t2